MCASHVASRTELMEILGRNWASNETSQRSTPTDRTCIWTCERPSSSAMLASPSSSPSSMSASASSTSVGGRSSQAAPQSPALPRKWQRPAMQAPSPPRSMHFATPGTSAGAHRDSDGPRHSQRQSCATHMRRVASPSCARPTTRRACGDRMTTQMIARKLAALFITSEGSQLTSMRALPIVANWLRAGSGCRSRSRTCLFRVAAFRKPWSSTSCARPMSSSSLDSS
mmetsp:Transcript_35727/g.102071  ORF Transcript_35727/g.102071 Transcript_35727/m.102071 type:complete len:227 (+) Transcript_35727:2-682(+)